VAQHYHVWENIKIVHNGENSWLPAIHCARIMFLVVFGGLLLVLTVVWIMWSAFDRAISPQLYYKQSTFTCLVLEHCPLLQSPYVFFIIVIIA